MRGIWRLLGNLVRIVLAPLWWLARRLGRPKGTWLYLRVAPHLVELAEELPWWRRLSRSPRRRETQLVRVREVFARAAEDSTLEGCLLELHSLKAGWSSALALRDAVAALRATGKTVQVYLPHGGGDREWLVASAASRVWLAPESTLMLLGLSARATYWAALARRVGVRVEAHALGDYKTAAERWTRTGMSEAEREQVDALLGAIQNVLNDGLRARGLDGEAAQQCFAQAMFSAGQAERYGLADGACYPDELAGRLGEGGRGPAKWVPAGSYRRWHGRRLVRPVREPGYIAVVPVRGAIGLEEGGALRMVGVEGVVAKLRAAARDRRAQGVILHVDSPGGSALASDLIHREVERLGRRKPVVACFGEVAASGGYYVAAGARCIVAQPTCITGSIGVIAARVVVSELLERFDVHVETRRMTPHADLFSPVREATEEERALLEDHIRLTYQRFLQVVASGRRLSEEQVDQVARGRVWSGVDAQRLGLVDRLGGFDVALDELRNQLTHLPAEARARLAPQVVKTRRRSEPRLPPQGPRGDQAETGIGAVLAPLQVLGRLARREPVLCYALDLPDLASGR